ncbi:MAG: 16S rRNA (cytidine(1402)-2'-O)-methyltransferase [Deltaproteobacteria bacterium]|nr:MAG: 16S rRNA (cytidine(1402)-2'-O)-methyltransferase [Deltaproteobacteria bacterium]
MPSTSHTNPGMLFIVSTPIGNLEDITLRALKTLKEVDIIAAEKVSHTRGLCGHYGIKTRVVRYNQHNRNTKAPELIGKLKRGANIALVTDAGTPGVSDPGTLLISKAAQENVRITPIPGPSAVTGAVSISGFPAEQFVFGGFLPPKAGKRRQALRAFTSEHRTMVFFEAPHRLRAMLADTKEVLGDREIVVIREMTKLYEQIYRGNISDVLENLPADRIRGELTLVVKGRQEKLGQDQITAQVLERIDKLLAEKKLSVKDIAGIISLERELPYRQIYKICLERKTGISSTETQ